MKEIYKPYLLERKATFNNPRFLPCSSSLMSQSASSVTSIDATILEMATSQNKEKQDTADIAGIEEEDGHPIVPKGWKKTLLVSLLCGAQLFDIFSASSAIAALPTVCRSFCSLFPVN